MLLATEYGTDLPHSPLRVVMSDEASITSVMAAIVVDRLISLRNHALGFGCFSWFQTRRSCAEDHALFSCGTFLEALRNNLCSLSSIFSNIYVSSDITTNLHCTNQLNLVRVTPYLQWGRRISNGGCLAGFANHDRVLTILN